MVKINPVTCVMEAMRAITLEGWDWGTILTWVWVAVGMLAVLPAATTWMYWRSFDVDVPEANGLIIRRLLDHRRV